mgnify:CR=1 FL=1
MNFHLSKKISGPKHKKDGRVNPHRFWLFFMSITILVLTINIIYFTYFFIVLSKKLDEPVAPKLDTNTGEIRKIETTVTKTEEAVSSRVNATQNP